MKIVIIKLGAKGDVVRTMAILPALKKKYPDSEITWITKSNVSSLFEGNSFVSRLCEIPCEINEKFDILYNFDIEEDATKLAKEINADKKYGFYSEDGFAQSFNSGAEYYLNTMFDDELKKSNRKTYQEMMFEAAEMHFAGEHCPIFLNEKDKEYAGKFVRENKINVDKLVGIHLGASPRWPSKAWAEENVGAFIKMCKKNGYEVLLFGGPDEIERQKRLSEKLLAEGVKICRNDSNNSDREFASLIGICKAVICSDSFALHISLALKKPTIGLFFCTSPYEIEGYGLLTKIVSLRFEEFFPEKMDQYDEDLVKSISAEEVFNVLQEIIKNEK